MRIAWFVVAVAACASHPQHPVPIAIIVQGDRAALGSAAVDDLELRPVALPEPPAPPPDTASPHATKARSAYAAGNFDACRAELAQIDVPAVLAHRGRALAARALLLHAACEWGATDQQAARAIAAQFASYGLELPAVAVSPDVERVIGEAITAAGSAPRTQLDVTGEVGARLALDGGEASCTLPCTLDVAPGDHVLAVDADGFAPAVRAVRAPSPKLAIAQQPASPELAAQQWRARAGRGLPPADPVGARLLGELTASRRVAVVTADKQLGGELVVDGRLAATASAERGDGRGLLRELAYDGGVLARPTLVQRPWFWIAVSAVAVAAAGTVYYFNRPIDTSVGFSK